MTTPKLIAHEEGCPALAHGGPCSSVCRGHACTCRGAERLAEFKARGDELAEVCKRWAKDYGDVRRDAERAEAERDRLMRIIRRAYDLLPYQHAQHATRLEREAKAALGAAIAPEEK